MEKLHNETNAFHSPHLRQSTAFTIPSRSNSLDDEESDNEEWEREEEQEDAHSNSASASMSTEMLNGIAEDEDILLLEVDSQLGTTLINRMLTCVVQSSWQHIKRPTPVPSLTETINKMTANMPNNSRKTKANRLSRKNELQMLSLMKAGNHNLNVIIH
jgi:hypothetical protein